MNAVSNLINSLDQNSFAVVLLVVTLWTTAWKAVALWRSARSEQKYWFIAILLLNTIGVVEIIYLTFFQKDKPFIKNKKFIKDLKKRFKK